jgi:hypothetical protein
MAYQQTAWGGGYTSPLTQPPAQYGSTSQTFAQELSAAVAAD